MNPREEKKKKNLPKVTPLGQQLGYELGPPGLSGLPLGLTLQNGTPSLPCPRSGPVGHEPRLAIPGAAKFGPWAVVAVL